MISKADFQTTISSKIKGLPPNEIHINHVKFSFKKVITFDFSVDAQFKINSGQRIHKIKVRNSLTWDNNNNKIQPKTNTTKMKNNIGWQIFLKSFSDEFPIDQSTIQNSDSDVNITNVKKKLQDKYSKTVRYTNKNNNQKYSKLCVPSLNQIEVYNIKNLYELYTNVTFQTGKNSEKYVYQFEGNEIILGSVIDFNYACEVCYKLEKKLKICRKCGKEICASCYDEVKLKRTTRFVCSISCCDDYIHDVSNMKLQERMIEEGVYSFSKNLKRLSLILYLVLGGGGLIYLFGTQFSFMSIIIFPILIIISSLPLVFQSLELRKDKLIIENTLGRSPIITMKSKSFNSSDQIEINPITLQNLNSDNNVYQDIVDNEKMETTEESTPLKYLPELNIEVRSCCYQTARLNEIYCWCGRSIPSDLQGLFN